MKDKIKEMLEEIVPFASHAMRTHLEDIYRQDIIEALAEGAEIQEFYNQSQGAPAELYATAVRLKLQPTEQAPTKSEIVAYLRTPSSFALVEWNKLADRIERYGVKD